jgi:hypothetical protein
LECHGQSSDIDRRNQQEVRYIEERTASESKENVMPVCLENVREQEFCRKRQSWRG